MKNNQTVTFPHQSFKDRTTPIVALIGAAALSLASTAQAAVIAGTASGVGLNLGVSALSLASLQVGPLASVQVASPSPDSAVAGVLSVNQSVALGSVVSQNGGLDAITSSTSSNVTGLATTGLSTGSATTKNLAVTVVPAVGFLTPSLLSITSSTISSTSTSSGAFGTLGSTGTSVLENLAITVEGVSITIPINPAPNTVLILTGLGINPSIVAGLSIILNEQTVSGNGIGSTSITTNALHVRLTALSLGLVSGVNGDIIVGQSSSSLAAVPETSAIALLGLTSFTLLRRGRDR